MIGLGSDKNENTWSGSVTKLRTFQGNEDDDEESENEEELPEESRV